MAGEALMGLAREILLRGSQSRWLEDQLTQRRFTRRAVERFMPGEDMNSAIDATESLKSKGITTILTLLGENVTDARAADGVVDHYLHVLDRIREMEHDSDISVKPTQLGIDLDPGQTCARYETLVKYAATRGRRVAVDMEDSSYVDRTIELYRELRESYDNVTLCLQAYLYRTTSDLVTLLPTAPSIRLVKGAYKEPRQIAFHRKKHVDANFLRLADTILQEVSRGAGVRAHFGTHDPQMINGVINRADTLGLPKNAYEFQLLYGIRRDLQDSLAAEGYRIRVLISYGDSWFPWYMRRLAERPANLLFLARNLVAG
jgi:proline dehydrogenase